MHKSTIFLAVLCLMLISAIGSVIWWTVRESGQTSRVTVEGVLQIGLADVQPKTGGQTVSASSAMLWNTDAQVIYFERNAFDRRPIASITKLMTAMVALDFGFDWDKEIAIEPDEYVMGGQLLLAPGEFVTMRDLLNVSLISSANNTTLALVRALGVPEEEFVQAMNRKAIELGLEQTEFVDVTGLDPDNVSSAYEVARMAEAVWRDYPIIAEITSRAEYSFTIGGTGREHTIRNSNKLISEQGLSLTGGKTGYLYESGYCLVVQGAGAGGSRIAVVLDSPSERDSMNDIKRLLEY
ncbi:MAG: serine hydrolase [bacterium]